MPLSRPMASFASNTRNYAIELNFPVDQRGSGVATEAVASFIAVDVAACGFFYAWRWIESVSNRPIQPVNRRVVTHATLVEPSTTAEHIGLGDVGVTECIEDRLTEGFFSVSHTIDALQAVTYDLIGKPPGLKRHPRMTPQHSAFCRLLQSMSHSGLQMRATFLCVTTGARPWAYKALPRHLLSRSKVGKRACVAWFCLRERCARKKKRTRGPAPDAKLSSYEAWKHHIPGLNSGLTQRILRRLFLNDSLSFHYGQDAVHTRHNNLFSLAARPMNLNFFNFCGCPQPEMKTQIRA